MYKIKDAQWGDLIEEILSPVWVRQQERVDLPICCDSYEEADGLVLSDGNTMVGIAGRGMENYEPYLMAKLNELQSKVSTIEQQSATTSAQVSDLHATQAGNVVVKSELDKAYADGVNAV
jgi:hypothetical protein